jgi:hypothetical protein
MAKHTDLHIQALEAAFKHHEYFGAGDLLAFYQVLEPSISKSTVNWRMHTLLQTNIICRVGRGKYKFGNANVFVPQIGKKAIRINNLMKEGFPYLNYMIWHINEINSLSQHLINRDIYYVEVEREAIDAVFQQLREKFKYVLRKKTDTDLYFGEGLIVVRPFITAAPVQFISQIPTTTIEKLLVDLFSDKEFYFLQGYELTYIFGNAFSKYTINIDKLLRYASRRGKKEEIVDFIDSIK